MQYTTNYGLTKLELSDSPADITEINDNWETIDEKLKEHADMLNGTTGSIAFTNKENTFTQTNTFSNANPYVNFSHTGITKGTIPDSTLTQTIYFRDKNNSANLIGYLQSLVLSDGKTKISLTSYANNEESADKGSIGVTINQNGDAAGFAPTPPASSDTNEIATTEWVRDRIPELAPEPDLSDYVKSVNNVTPDPETGNVKIEIPDFVPSGTKMLFYEAAAPTGWTKLTGVGNSAVKIVEDATGGTVGGTVNFSDVFKNLTSSSTTVTISGTTGGRAITIAQLAKHSHTLSIFGDQGSNGTNYTGRTKKSTDSTGSDQTHNHTFSGSQAHTHTVNIAVKYTNVIICKKD